MGGSGGLPATIGGRNRRMACRTRPALKYARAPEPTAASLERGGERGNAGGCTAGGRRPGSARRQVGGLGRRAGGRELGGAARSGPAKTAGGRECS